jgi:hypothetical protein
MTKSVLPSMALVCLALALSSSTPAARPTGERSGLASLSALFDVSRGAVRDTNGDGLADAVAARVVVPADPSRHDIQAAAEVAARLGFETTALTLPLVVRDREVGSESVADLLVLIGRRNALVEKLAAARAIDLAALAEGQGIVALVRSPVGPGDAVVVAGADDEGTLAAARVLAARLPRLWSMSGATLGMVETQVVRLLRSRGVSAAAPAVRALVVDRDRRGLAAVTVQVEVPPAQARLAVRTLEDVDRAHRFGREVQTLNFSGSAETIVECLTGETVAGRATVRRSGPNPRTLTPPIEPGELAPDSPGERGAVAAAAPPPAKTFDLAGAYTIDGWYGDAYRDLIPDRTDTTVVIGEATDALGAAHIAARLGLETTGLGWPLVRRDEEVRDPAREPNPILVGRTNRLVQELVKVGKARLEDLGPGEGAVQVVPRAFGNATATVVAGADAAGTEAASLYLARRWPYLWEIARGAAALEDLKAEATRFFQAKSAAGQAGQALEALDQVLRDLQGKQVESLDVTLLLEAGDPALDRWLAGELGRLVGAPVTVKSQGITDPVTVFEETIDLPWEVDEFRARFRAAVLPQVKAGSRVELEARLSESPAVRQQVAAEVRAALEQAGAVAPRVRILSAYKQGFLWLTEQVIPELKGKGVRSVQVRVAAHKPDYSKKYKFYQVPSRWLHELYPVDEIFARELGIPKDRFSLELVDDAQDIYTVEAADAAGRIVARAAFSPKFVEREYLDKFPGWSRVDVTTGWIWAAVDGRVVVDARIPTDPERFWDHYQGKVLPRIYDHVMKVTENRPMPEKQPFHRDLDIEVWMSEPDFRIGVDEEQVSSLESLHEDLYFVTLDFFDALGRTTVRRRLAAPGKIYPIIHPERPGAGARARILFAGNAASKPALQVSYRVKGEDKPVRVARDLLPAEVSPPVVARVVARRDGLREIELQVEARDDAAAGRAADALDGLRRLHAAGLYRSALSYQHVDQIAVTVVVGNVRTRRVIPHTGEAAPSNVHRAAARPALPLVTWDHVIGPDEAEAIVKKLAAFPEVRAYRAGRSYRGRDISVAEITLPAPSELVSITKLTAYKPTILITGRQHANEVSSTSHILKLGERLVTDPEYRAILQKVNVILHPVENPDGAQMAYELQKLTPTHMLHAGRYSALGMDVASQVGRPDPLLPEALVRGRLWREWLPDIYLNPHGYPSHEWVQQFAGYVPPGFRAYWSSRGWYTSLGGLRDPRYPDHVAGTEALREAIVREINRDPDVRAMNLRHQDRYRRWAYGFAPFVYAQEIYKDTAIYYTDPETGEPRGRRRAPDGDARTMTNWPQVTFVSGGTEAPDETAQGDWLALVTKPGFSFLMAHITYLRDGQYRLERIEEDGAQDAVSLTVLRVRPVRPGRATGARAAAR